MIKKLLKPIARRWPFPVRATLKSGRRMYVDLRSGIGQGIFVTGEFDPAVFAPIADQLDAGAVLFDVGANVGYYSIRSLDRIGTQGVVHAFEIDPRPLQCLRRSKRDFALENLHIHEIAIGARQGTGVLTRERDCGHSHVEPTGRGDAVQMTSIDAIVDQQAIGRVDVIKMDVEGSEFEVLKGAETTIMTHRPVMVIEADDSLLSRHKCSVQQITDWLGERDYGYAELADCWSPTLVARPN